MPTLYLLRHAHAASAAPDQDDFDRPLDERGQAEASRMGAHLARTEARVGAALCSSARRTVETWSGLISSWDVAVEPVVLDVLYLASASELLTALRGLPPDLESALVVAHNPGTQELAVSLTGQGDRDAYERMRASYPSAALSEFRFDGEWNGLGPGRAGLVRFDVVRALE